MGSSSAKGNNNNKGKSYAVIVLLAFGAALFGVMLLQKFRERRIFNLLVQEKDHQVFSLQLLLQKEKEYIKELKKKTIETKAKMLSLRSQKALFENRNQEMKATIASLQEELRLVNLKIEEKQNEITVITEKETELRNNEKFQVMALTEMLKQKESEIEELKYRVENPITKNGNTTMNEIVEDSGFKDENGNFSKREIIEENPQKIKYFENEVNATEEVDSNASSKKDEIFKENLKFSQESDELGTISENGVKIKISNSANFKKPRNGYSKRWRMIARNRRNLPQTGSANVGDNDSISNFNLIRYKRKLDLSETLRKHDQGTEYSNVSKLNNTINSKQEKIEEDGLVESMELEHNESNNEHDFNKEDNNAEKLKILDVQKEQDDDRDSNINGGDGDILEGSGLEVEDDREEENKKETEETDF